MLSGMGTILFSGLMVLSAQVVLIQAYHVALLLLYFTMAITTLANVARFRKQATPETRAKLTIPALMLETFIINAFLAFLVILLRFSAVDALSVIVPAFAMSQVSRERNCFIVSI
jgi:hypothetical protein